MKCLMILFLIYISIFRHDWIVITTIFIFVSLFYKNLVRLFLGEKPKQPSGWAEVLTPDSKGRIYPSTRKPQAIKSVIAEPQVERKTNRPTLKNKVLFSGYKKVINDN